MQTAARLIWALVLVGAVTVPRASVGLTLRPMSEEALVASADLIVLGTVEAVASGEWRGRIVTWVDVATERTLKGRVEGASIRLTEAGGRAGTRRLVIPGAPRYVVGEHVLVFARVWGEGLLRTHSFGLGKYVVHAAPSGTLQARRRAPATSPRPLDGFLERIESLVGPGPQRPVPNGRTADQLSATAAPFKLGIGDPPFRGRWFEADCGLPVELSLQNVDPILGEAATRAVVDSAVDAWSAAPEGSIELVLGPDTAPSSSETIDGINSILFEDPFDEILDDLVGCAGVRAVGGFFADDSIVIDIGGNDFARSVEGFVVVNEGVTACIDEVSLAEVLAHEVGHLIGFGHSSEDPGEPDPVLEDALMYFLLHGDGRGATLRADDRAGLAVLYPPLVSIDPISDAVADYACQYNLGPFGAACFMEPLNSPQGLLVPAAPVRRYEKAARLAAKAVTAPKAKKERKLVKKSCKQAFRSRKKGQKFFDRGEFPTGCFNDLHEAATRGVDQADALLTLIDQRPWDECKPQ